MRVCSVQAAVVKEGLVEVTARDWASDIKAGQLLEQMRGETSIHVWEVLAEKDDTLVLSPTSDVEVEILPGDDLDACVGGLSSHLGLGDAIAIATKAIGIRPCEACEERRKKLNRLFPEFWRR